MQQLWFDFAYYSPKKPKIQPKKNPPKITILSGLIQQKFND
ncbi:hypothetical protein J576_3389 [Acinetobacter sp. 766875]|nr:hypothetical protein J576_3389 [Acinetobacter sp. 766875]